MDPKANIEEQGDLASCLLISDYTGRPEKFRDDAERLAELVQAHIEWRENGGFDPFAA